MDKEIHKEWSKIVDEAAKEPLPEDYAGEVQRESIRLLLRHGISPGTIKTEVGRECVHRLNQSKIGAVIPLVQQIKAKS